jgi:glutaredoxin
MTEEESNACPYCKAQNEEYERKQKEFEAKKAELEREEKARYK